MVRAAPGAGVLLPAIPPRLPSPAAPRPRIRTRDRAPHGHNIPRTRRHNNLTARLRRPERSDSDAGGPRAPRRDDILVHRRRIHRRNRRDPRDGGRPRTGGTPAIADRLAGQQEEDWVYGEVKEIGLLS